MISAAERKTTKPAARPALATLIREAFGFTTRKAPSAEVPHYAYIDSLRGWAILLVVLVHVTLLVPGLPYWPAIFAFKGAYGVQLFFMASALTLFMSYRKRQKDEGDQTEKCFFIRRFFRIAPMYYAAAALYTVVYLWKPLTPIEDDFSVRNLVLSLLFVNSFYPFGEAINYIPPGCWSVAIEMVFYLFMPVLFKRITTLRQSIYLFIGATALSMSIKYLWHIGVLYSVTWYLDLCFPNNFAVFALGIMVYFILQRTWRPHPVVGALLYIPVFGASLLLFYVYERMGRPYFLPEHILISIVMAGFVILMAKRGGIVFINPIIRHIGKVSFSLYLTHFLLLRIAVLSRIGSSPHPPMLNLIMLYGIVVVLGVAISTLTYTYIEKPGIELSRILTRRLLAKPKT